MLRRFALVSLGSFCLAGLGAAQGAEPPDPDALIRPAGDTELSEFLWTRRPIVVFADNPADPRFIQQMEYIEERLDALAERDVVVITDTDPAARTPIRNTLRARGFMLVLVAKDGSVILRKPAPWHVREITRSIDKQPLRQQELREKLDAER